MSLATHEPANLVPSLLGVVGEGLIHEKAGVVTHEGEAHDADGGWEAALDHDPGVLRGGSVGEEEA